MEDVLKLKVKKQKLKRKVDGVLTEGYYGRVITSGTKTFRKIAENASLNTSLHRGEVVFAADLLLEGAARALVEGYIVDLGPLGKLYPSVDSVWHTDKEDVKLAEMSPRVTYRPSHEVKAAIRTAEIGWTTAAATSENSDEEDEPTITPSNGDNNGGGSDPEDNVLG